MSTQAEKPLSEDLKAAWVLPHEADPCNVSAPTKMELCIIRKVESLEGRLAAADLEIRILKGKITYLNGVIENSDSINRHLDEAANDLKNRAGAAESRLGRAKELIEKWRDMEDDHCRMDEDAQYFAEQLEKALGEGQP